MKADTFPQCPHCGSDDVLPFEEEGKESKTDASMFIVIVSALVLIFGYFFFAISSYIYFPLFIFGLIAVATRFVRNSETVKRKTRKKPRDYMCVECGGFFRH